MGRYPRPRLFIVGAAKSGTTALYSWLKPHSQIFFPEVKEPNYFALSLRSRFCVGPEMDVNYRNSFALSDVEYEAIYSGSNPGQILGDASPSSLYFPGTAKAIWSYESKSKIIGIFRNPVDRIVSQYRHNRRDGYEPCAHIEEALAREQGRSNMGWWWGFHYRAASFYAEQWREYVAAFPEHQRLALRYDDIESEPEETWRKVCDFLEIDADILPDFKTRVNDTSQLSLTPANGDLEKFIRHPSALKSTIRAALPKAFRRRIISTLRAANSTGFAEVSNETKARLREEFRNDVEQLERLTDLDLARWSMP